MKKDEEKQKGYSIRLIMPDGKPNDFKIISKMNWTGIGLQVSRDAWEINKDRDEFTRAGVYILWGYGEDQDSPKVYIGQGDSVKDRIESHYKAKDFWDKVLVFVSSNEGLNKAHITWIEWALIKQAKEMKRCKLDNTQYPNEPTLAESDKVDIQEFLEEMLSIFPLVEVKIFDKAEKITLDKAEKITFDKAEKTMVRGDGQVEIEKTEVQDTIVVPANKEGFDDVFLEKNCWYAIRIASGMLKKIRYIAAYQTKPISAITHTAEVESIEVYGDGGKYQLNFKESSVKKLPNRIKLKGPSKGIMQSARYTNYTKLNDPKTKTTKDVWP